MISAMLFNEHMKLIDDIRRENLDKLAEEFGGVAGLSRKLERSESQVSQWINGSPLPSGKKRGMQSATARWIEDATGKPPGWLDHSHEPNGLAPQDRAFVQRVEQEVARYVVSEEAKRIILATIKTQPPRRTGSADTDHPHPEAKAA